MACEQYNCADQVTVLQFVGGITGSYIDAALTEKGIKHINVEIPRPTRTCTTVLCRATNTMTELIEPSANIDADSREELEKIAIHLLSSSADTQLECIALCGTLPPGITGQSYTTIALHKPPHVLLFMDAAQEVQVLETGMVDILKVNAEEAALIAGFSEDEQDIYKVGSVLMESLSLKILAITNGPGEAYLFENVNVGNRRSNQSLARIAPNRSHSVSSHEATFIELPVETRTREFQSYTSVPSSPATLLGGNVTLPLNQPESVKANRIKNGVRRTFSVSERSHRSSPQSYPNSVAQDSTASGFRASTLDNGDIPQSAISFQDRAVGSLGSADLFSSVDETIQAVSQRFPKLARNTGRTSTISANSSTEYDVRASDLEVYKYTLPDIQSLIESLDDQTQHRTANPEVSSAYLPSPTLSEAPKWGRSRQVMNVNSTVQPLSTSLNPLGAGDTCSGVFVMAYLQSNRTDARGAFQKGLAAASASCLMLDHTAHFDRRVMELISSKIVVDTLK